MSGSSAPARRLPRPLELGCRALLASVLVLSLAEAYERSIVQSLAPAFSSAVWWLSSEFTVTSAEIVRDGPVDVLRFHADLSLPLHYAGLILYPSGWYGAVPTGGFQVTRTLGSVLQYEALMLTLVLAWPARRLWEVPVRLALSLPLLAALLFADVPVSVVAGLWTGLREQFNPHSYSAWMVLSRYLTGGGGVALACVFAAGVIGAAQRIAAR